MPTLLGEDKKQLKNDYLYWEFKTSVYKKAVRMGDWKLIRIAEPKNNSATYELFNVNDDESEEKDFSDERPELVNRLEKIMDSY